MSDIESLLFSSIQWLEKELKEGGNVRRAFILWQSDCAARVLPIFHNYRPGDLRCKYAIEIVRDYERGEQDAEFVRGAAQRAEGAAVDVRAVWQSTARARWISQGNDFDWDFASAAAAHAAKAAAHAAKRAEPLWTVLEAASAVICAEDAQRKGIKACRAAKAAEHLWQLNRLAAYLHDPELSPLPLDEGNDT